MNNAELFYEAMQRYRHAPLQPPDAVYEAFNDVIRLVVQVVGDAPSQGAHDIAEFVQNQLAGDVA